MTLAKRNADSLFQAVSRLAPGDHQVEPTEDGGYSMLIESDDGESVVRIECDSDGGVLCIASIGENLRRAKYYQMDGLPDGFIREALRDVTPEREQTAPWLEAISTTMKDFGETYTPAEVPKPLLPNHAKWSVFLMHSWLRQMEQFPLTDWTQQTFELPQLPLTAKPQAGQFQLPSTVGLSYLQGKPDYMDEQ